MKIWMEQRVVRVTNGVAWTTNWPDQMCCANFFLVSFLCIPLLDKRCFGVMRAAFRSLEKYNNFTTTYEHRTVL